MLLDSIAFDIDDTVVETSAVLIGHYNRSYGTCFTYEKWVRHKLGKADGFDSDLAYQIFEYIAENHLIPLIPKAQDVLSKVHTITKKPLTFVTARRLPYALSGLNFLYANLDVPLCVVTSSADDTKLFCLEELGISTLVEDSPFEIQKYLDHDINVILLERPWNEAERKTIKHPNLFVVKDWNEIETLLFKEEIT
jgi:FMN phosphatase YigB (HAD superfamily)